MKQNTDQDFRDLAETSHQLPSAHVWQQIDKSINQKESKMLLWVFFSLAIIGIVLVGISSLTNPSEATNTATFNSNNVVDTKSFTNNSLLLSTAQSNETLSSTITPSYSAQQANISNQTKTNSTGQTSLPRLKQTGRLTTNSTPTPYFTENTYHPVSTSVPIDEGATTKENTTESIVAPIIEKETKLEVEKAIDFAEETDNTTPTLDDPCPAINNRVRKLFFVEVGGNLGRHANNYTSNNESAIALRQETEKEWYTWGGFAGIGIYLKPNIYLRADFDWMQQKDLFEYKKQGVSRLIVDYDPLTGDQISSHTQTVSWTSDGEITRSYTDIGLNFGYMFTRRRSSKYAWKIGIEPGMLFNISVLSKGKVMIADDQISRLKEEEQLYEKKLGLGYQAQFILEKPLNNGFSLTVKPNFRSYKKAWGKTPNKVSTNTFGLKLGVRKLF